MSLVVWLPLNGNSENQGTEQYKETMNTLEYTSNGKTTNKCMNLGRLQYDKNPLGMVGSICFWIYPKSTDEGSNGKPQPIFGDDTWSTSSRKWTLYLYSSQPSVTPHNTSLHSWGCQKDGNSNPNGDFVINGVLKESAWNHVCVAHDLDYEYVYINGTLKHKVKWDSNGTFTFDVGTPIIYGDYNNYESNYRLNDFRIYNHCLTQSEVSEIAKGLMLHYSFENPYAEETTNISHSLVNTAYVSLGSDDTGNYFIKNSGGQGWNGLSLQYVPATGGNYYTWSLEVNPTVDLYIENQIEIIDSYVDTILPIGSHCYFDRNLQPTSTWEGNDKGAIITSTFQGNLPKNTWTKVWFTVYVVPEVGSTKLFHHFCPQIPTGDTSLKIYYRNSMFEKKNHMTLYTSSNREAGLIRDNSGMGNDGTQVYQRIEIPITGNTTINSLVWTAKDPGEIQFEPYQNQRLYIGYMSYNSNYFYLNSVISYEFDIKLENATIVDGKSFDIWLQGMTTFNDGTSKWLDGSAVFVVKFPNRLKNGVNGNYHITIEKVITNLESITNVNKYSIELRVDFMNSGTITVSNFKCYYQNLDTSKLTIADKSAVGTHSAYFNGKNYIDCGLVTPLEIDELTLSCWAYRDDWSTLPTGGVYGSALISSVNSGGFGFKLERCAQESIDKSINFVIYYKDAGYLERVKSYGMAIDYTKLSSGWHLITGVATRNKAILYIDGEKVRECIHNLNKPIYNYDTTNKKRNNLLVGAECEVTTSPPTALGVYIDDVRLYATALSDKDIKALYNVKTKIDNKSNLYCNQLVETKSENLVDYSLFEPGNYGGVTHSTSYKDGIYTMIIASNTATTAGQQGPYFRGYEKNSPNHRPIIGEYYKLSMYVKVPKTGAWLIGSEVLPFKQKQYEAGKWYYIEQEGNASNGANAIIFYIYDVVLNVGDKIQVRDLKFYRLYNDENYNPGPNIKGQYKTFELNETFNEDVENSGATIVDKYGAEWLEVFYHDNNNCKVFFDSQTEALHTNSQYKFSILDQLEKFRGNDSKFEFLLEYPTDIPSKYNRWKQTDNPVKVLANNTYANGYEAIHVDWPDNNWGGLLRDTNSISTLLKGSIVNTDNWFFAIGAIKAWGSSYKGVPGPYPGASGYSNPNGIVHDIHLYVRIDNLEDNDNFKIYNRKTKTKEIIEI